MPRVPSLSACAGRTSSELHVELLRCGSSHAPASAEWDPSSHAAVLQEGGLRTYLLAYGAYFHSLSLDQLCQMFELPEKQARFMSVLAPDS